MEQGPRSSQDKLGRGASAPLITQDTDRWGGAAAEAGYVFSPQDPLE